MSTFYGSNSKLAKVNPIVETGAYIKGSDSGNFFLIVSENSKGIVAFRPLATKVPVIGSAPKAGQETRVRVVPTSASAQLTKLMEKFGFGTVNGGSNPVHYSKVTKDPAAAVADAQFALGLIS